LLTRHLKDLACRQVRDTTLFKSLIPLVPFKRMYRPPQQMVLLPGFTPMQAAGRGRGRGKPRGGKNRGGKNKKKNKNAAQAAANPAQPTTVTSKVAPPPLIPPPERNAPPEQIQQPDEAPLVEETSQSFISSTEAMEDTIEVSVNEDFAGETWQIISEETASPEMKEDDTEFTSDILSTGDLFSQQSASEDVLLEQPEVAIDANDYQEDIIDIKVEEPLSTHEEEISAVEETVSKSEEQTSSIEHPLPDETEKTVEESSTASKRTAISAPKDGGKETTQKPLPLKCEVKIT